MKVLSFDIGIRNLAFCIGTYDKETGKIAINEWDIINLLEEEEEQQCQCSHISKRKPYAQCPKAAIYGLANEKEYYCKAHLKNYTYVKPTIMKYEGDKIECFHEDCHKSVRYTINNLQKCCPSHKKEIETHFKKNHSLKKIKTVKCKEVSAEKIADKIVSIFDEKYSHFLDCNLVLLELQPMMKAPKMKTISNYMSMYFRIRGIHDIEDNKMKNVLYYRATHKLTFNDNNTYADIKTYKNRKNTAINNVIEYLDDVEDYENKEKFLTHKKKDDLSDALLQILSYFKKN